MTRGAETKHRTVKRITNRVMLVIIFFLFLSCCLIVRAVQLQVLDKDFLNQQADTRHLRTEVISAHRGSILDRKGDPLAISTPVDSIWVNPKKLSTPLKKFLKLQKLLM